MDPPVGSVVTVPQGKGTVRFSGTTSFAPGKWIGIELYEPNGKNDGSVKGVSYFNCKMLYGVFVRQSQIKNIHGLETDSTPAARPQPSPGPTRPAAGHQRTNSSGLLRANTLRQSVNLSAANALPRVQSPAKSQSSLSQSIPHPTPSTSKMSRANAPSPTKRIPSLTEPRKPLLRQSPGSDVSSSPAPSSPNLMHSKLSLAHPQPRTSSPLSGPQDRPPSAPSPPPSSVPSASHYQVLSSPQVVSITQGTPSQVSQTLLPTALPPRPQDEQELQELRAKIRVLEAKRTDDARHVRELENRLQEAEAFVALRPKLQAKFNQLQKDLIATRRELADAQQLSQLAESRVMDSQEQLEMAMLDKEVAEERAEAAESGLEEAKERLAVLEVEMGVLKGEREGEGGEMPAKDSLAYIQLEKQNERLKEALIKLRDLSQESEQEQRKRIQEMEKDVEMLDELQVQYDEALIKLANAETEIEGLKLQLDDTLHAEDLLVKLTERNLELGEKIEEMRVTIEDLEALKELNDELEENHIETEKQLNEDLEQRDIQIHEQRNKIAALEDAYQDLEGTVTQFRELVLQLQSELDTLRAQTQTAQSESASAASQAAALMSLNMKLQSSAVKNQAKNIELEIKRLEARESKELLSIIQPYLPQLYIQSDSDATSCYLFFLRLAFKTELINTVVAQKHNIPESLIGSVSEVLVGICEMRGRIAGLSTLCRRFAAIMKRCDVETFLNVGRIYPEIAPLEKRIDMHIDLLRRDEFREMECVSDIAKLQAQFDHLAETYFEGFEYDLGERQLGYAISFDLDLDMFSASIALIKTCVAALVDDEDAVLELGSYDINAELLDPLQALLDKCKSAKSLFKKFTKRLEDLTQESAALKVAIIPQLEALSNPVAELVNFGISLAQLIMSHTNDARSSKALFQLTVVLDFIKNTAKTTVAKDSKAGQSPWDAVGNAIAQMVEGGSKLLPSVLGNENVIKITGTAPWVTRIDEIKAALEVNVEAERKVGKLNDEMQGLVRTLKSKDQSIQEASVKIELMERRMEAARKQAEIIASLENEVLDAKKQKRVYEEAMEQLQADLDSLEQDNARLKTMTAGQEKQAPGIQPIETENVPIEGSLETSYLLEQIEALRGTVRFLRTENSYLKGQDLLRELESLPPLPASAPRTPTPPLDPSGLSDTEDSDSDTPHTPPTLRSLSTETKLLYRDVIRFSSSPRVVDLSTLNSKRAEAKTGGRAWMPKGKTPAHQVLERKMQAERLGRRVQGLLEKASALKEIL